jgi:hypothetical protein
MAAQHAPAGVAPVWSQQSSVEDESCDATTDASSSPATSYETVECSQTDIPKDIEFIAAYFVKEKAPGPVRAAFDRVSKACSRRVAKSDEKSTEQAIRQLQAVVQKLADKVEKTSNGTERPVQGSYAAVAGWGLPTQTRAQQSLNADHVIPQKQVPLRHKREIIIVQGNETIAQKN